ncbi:conidiation-specific protein Con-10 [Aspergillus sp. HF37]|nr:conidiation-specific protein Con-10 [Aspergillus sp. HF37]
MQRSILRATPLKNYFPSLNLRQLATETHPNPGNFSNRSKREMAQIGRKGGRKGGKARGVGGFHEMDPDRQHQIASRGGKAANKAGAGGRGRPQGQPRGTTAAEGTPSVAPPGFEESRTA